MGFLIQSPVISLARCNGLLASSLGRQNCPQVLGRSQLPSGPSERLACRLERHLLQFLQIFLFLFRKLLFEITIPHVTRNITTFYHEGSSGIPPSLVETVRSLRNLRSSASQISLILSTSKDFSRTIPFR